ncbi:MAG: hypothetical protein NZ480_08685 [Bdellovibrionaceae bacterium]|nr:hypothetical protein [Pseudobdellovibrionaceae bacterium]
MKIHVLPNRLLNHLGRLSLFAFGFLTLLVFLGCQQSSSPSGTHQTPPPAQTQSYYPYQCWNCPVGQTVLLQNVQGMTVDGSLEVHVQIRGALRAGCEFLPGKEIMCAFGPAQLEGWLRINYNYNYNNYCSLPTGDYSLRPIYPSNIYNTVLFGGLYEAVGPSGVVFRLHVNRAIPHNPNTISNHHPNNRIDLSAIIYLDSGGLCGSIATY